ncbi:hypothetical protein [Hymenobacter cavernae]|uniref:hypothetical protein n=1 Tax=Hymenobacter cavernae TaxID=2044852 RepID=UPI0016654497|nr:hypothetical protein [Hymenobacter cavernae]
MLYQLYDFLLWKVTTVDIVSVVLLLLLPWLTRRYLRRIVYWFVLLTALGNGFFKLLSASPGVVASTPVQAIATSKNFQLFRTFYYVVKFKKPRLSNLSDKAPRVQWKEQMVGYSATTTFDIENSRFFIVRKINGEWWFKPTVLINDTLVADLDTGFLPDHSGEMEQAVRKYQTREIGSYLSTFLTVVLVILLINRSRHLGSGASATALATTLRQPSLS